uniref:Cytochrome b5 heme-binding domain-containing protein n=1 Tax=Ananas comosus var. bracteatus TaxID=296719 RepID=A0A6V7NG16_ANACO|nr:unnamed protein product [Ananas comosus var. bracteatus]
MDDSSDFTFCKVSSQVDDDHLESPKAIPSIDNITLEDNHLDGMSMSRTENCLDGSDSHVDVAVEDEASGSLCDNESNSPQQKSNLSESATSPEVGKSGLSVNEPTQKKPLAKKPAVRAKVPFEKGYSQMDWLKLTRTVPDLAGRPNRQLISMDEVKQHKTTEGSIWTVLKGRVYNISPYMKFHPGGVDMLMKAAGKDCTSLFNKYHAWVNAEFLLEKCLVGYLDVN